MLYILLFSPSVPFTCFVYVPIFVASKLILDIQILGMEPTETLVFMVILSFCMILAPTVVFYIIQTHEISRFYQNQTAIMKQLQVTQVLNTQSDSIVVVSKHETDVTARSNTGSRSVSYDGTALTPMQELTFQFCNAKSVELFGGTLTEDADDVLHRNLFTPVDLGLDK